MTKASVVVFAEKQFLPFYRVLSISGEQVDYHSWREASDFVKDCEAEIVLIDCGLRIETGLNLVKRIKSLHPRTIVFFITDVSSEEAVISAFRAGARDYLRKPLDIGDLQASIRGFLAIKKTSKESRVPYVEKNPTKPTVEISSDKPSNLLNAIRYIQQNFTQEIHLEDCAREAKMSKYQFCRHFNRHFGITPMKFLTLVRLDRAKDLLQRNNLNVTEIAFEVGFGGHGSLFRAFKKMTGLNPNQYRMSFRKAK